MLKSKTVFVLGAGASKEVNLPIGSELRKIIAKRLEFKFDTFDHLQGSGDRKLFEMLNSKYRKEINTYLNACRLIRDGIIHADSIDDFIDDHKNNEYVVACGKLAIFMSILEAERNSKLYYKDTHIDDTINFDAIDDTWYSKFFKLIAKNISKDKIQDIFNNISVIIFNYDRCLEHYLVHATASKYAISLNDAEELVKKLTIYHPYNVVGEYFKNTGKPRIKFGEDIYNSLSIDDIMQNIKTYTEEVEQGDELINRHYQKQFIGSAIAPVQTDFMIMSNIQNGLKNSDIIVFLGMAYHPHNMSLLKNGFPKRIFATCEGISDSDKTEIQSMFYRLYCPGNMPPRVVGNKQFINFAKKCSDLFSEYRISLSSSPW
jgi:hypothetical protein